MRNLDGREFLGGQCGQAVNGGCALKLDYALLIEDHQLSGNLKIIVPIISQSFHRLHLSHSIILLVWLIGSLLALMMMQKMLVKYCCFLATSESTWKMSSKCPDASDLGHWMSNVKIKSHERSF